MSPKHMTAAYVATTLALGAYIAATLCACGTSCVLIATSTPTSSLISVYPNSLISPQPLLQGGAVQTRRPTASSWACFAQPSQSVVVAVPNLGCSSPTRGWQSCVALASASSIQLPQVVTAGCPTAGEVVYMSSRTGDGMRSSRLPAGAWSSGPKAGRHGTFLRLLYAYWKMDKTESNNRRQNWTGIGKFASRTVTARQNI
jgi:hypothetical protein